MWCSDSLLSYASNTGFSPIRSSHDAYSLGRRYRSDIDLGRQLPIVAANKVLAAPDVKAHPSRSWIYARGLRLLATAQVMRKYGPPPSSYRLAALPRAF